MADYSHIHNLRFYLPSFFYQTASSASPPGSLTNKTHHFPMQACSLPAFSVKANGTTTQLPLVLFLTHTVRPSSQSPSWSTPTCSVLLPKDLWAFKNEKEKLVTKQHRKIEWKPVGKTSKAVAQKHPRWNHRRKFRARGTGLKEAMRRQSPFKSNNSSVLAAIIICVSFLVSLGRIIWKEGKKKNKNKNLGNHLFLF